MSKKGLFFKTLVASNQNIRESRATIVNEDVAAEQEALVRALQSEVRAIQRELLKLTDLGKDSEISLKVVKDNFNAANWVAQVQSAKYNLLKKEEQLDIALDTAFEWFGLELDVREEEDETTLADKAKK